jgi:hypothetical protein
MPIPGDLCLLQNLKRYMGGASPVDASHDEVLSNLISAVSAAIARYLDRDLMSLGGQGLSSVVSVGSDAGGAYVNLAAPLSAVPPLASSLSDLTSGFSAVTTQPAAGFSSTTDKLYVSATTGVASGDAVACGFLTTYAETHNGSGKPWQWVRQWPIAAIVSAVDLPSNEAYPLGLLQADQELPRVAFKTPGLQTASALLAGNGAMAGGIFNPGIQNLQITYTAGYLTTPPDLSQAACELAFLWFRNRERIGVSAQGMLGTHVSFFNSSDLLPETRLKLNAYRRTIRGF